MSLRKILFIDRDGTLIQEPEDFQIDTPEKFALVPGVISALCELKRAGYQFVMITNQDGLGGVGYPQKSFDLIQSLLLGVLNSEGLTFESIRICPHFSADGCSCRKPTTGLVRDFLKTNDWDRTRSAVIGDRRTDLEFAENLGVQGLLLSNEQSWEKIVDLLTDHPRRAIVKRKTQETSVEIQVDLDQSEPIAVSTGIGFFDHMLEQIARHASISLRIQAVGDLEVDEHHLVEDVGLVLGQAIREALGDKRGIGRYGFLLPMDETLAQVALDLGGRPYFKFDGVLHRERVGELPTEMVIHFFRSISESLRANLHLKVEGENTHHQIEGLFKAFARSLRQAVQRNEGDAQLPSTKGVL